MINESRSAKRVLFIQALHSFSSGLLGVAIPLVMKARGVEVILMGFIFASMPLIMQVGRMFFAVISDFFGRKPFFILNGFLGIVSSLIYYFAHTPMEFLFGKIAEGAKEGSIWAVNRAYLLEKSRGNWKMLVNLRIVVYLMYSIGSLVAGFLIAYLLFEGTMVLCALLGVLGVLFSMKLADKKKGEFRAYQTLQLLSFKRKNRKFKVSLFLFLMMGLAFGFRSGYIIPCFLNELGFSAKAVGLILGVMVLLASLSAYIFSRCTHIRQLILVSGVTYSALLIPLGYSPPAAAAALVAAIGFAEGMNSIGQEGVLSKICNEESYGTDIGLLMMGLHIGESASLALSGILITNWGFAVSFILASTLYVIFYLGIFMLFEEE
jgi:MFS family permease